MHSFKIEGNIVQPSENRIIKGVLTITNGRITSIVKAETSSEKYILPGLIDAHVHIESSMLVPSEFARKAVTHGTTATVSDPHEIANVLGLDGIEFMIRNGQKTPFKFNFGAPSCVPATELETSGAVISSKEIKLLLEKKEVNYLAEMMNFPGVIFNDPEVEKKLKHAKNVNKPIDGHAPGLTGEQLQKYRSAGISTDHECINLKEAEEKVQKGMKILIREGSAAKNFDELIPLLNKYPEQIMFCCDDIHPDDLIKGHINKLIKRGLTLKYDFLKLIRACTLNPVNHYNLNSGLLRPGDPADFIIIDTPDKFNILATYIDGIKVAQNGESLIKHQKFTAPNKFNAQPIRLNDIAVKAISDKVKVIGVIDGQLFTKKLSAELPVVNKTIMSDENKDILKIIVLNRYVKAPPAVGFIKGMGLKNGAMASTVAHDSHNIIAVGTNDSVIKQAVDLIIDNNGGLAVVSEKETKVLPLPVAGLMSEYDADTTASLYQELDYKAKNLGSKLTAPFMTLSFMALLVIPELKLGDKGLFDGNKFEFINLFDP